MIRLVTRFCPRLELLHLSSPTPLEKVSSHLSFALSVACPLLKDFRITAPSSMKMTTNAVSAEIPSLAQSRSKFLLDGDCDLESVLSNCEDSFRDMIYSLATFTAASDSAVSLTE